MSTAGNLACFSHSVRGWAFIRVGVQLTTGGRSSDALQDLYKSLKVDSGQTINSVDDDGGVIQWQEH